MMMLIASFFKAMTSSWAAPPSLPQPITTSHDDDDNNNNNPLAEFAFIALIIIIGILIRYMCTRFKPSDDSDDFSETPQTQVRDHRRHLWPRNDNNNNSQPQRSVQRNHGLDPAIILALPVYYYHGDDAKYQVDCAICLSEFEESEDVKSIPFCKHVFHPNCLNKWLSVQVTCPVCRGGVSTRSDDQRRRSTSRSHDVCIEIHEGV